MNHNKAESYIYDLVIETQFVVTVLILGAGVEG